MDTMTLSHSAASIYRDIHCVYIHMHRIVLSKLLSYLEAYVESAGRKKRWPMVRV